MVFLKTPQLRELEDSTVFFFSERFLREGYEIGARDADEERYVQNCWGGTGGCAGAIKIASAQQERQRSSVEVPDRRSRGSDPFHSRYGAGKRRWLTE